MSQRFVVDTSILAQLFTTEPDSPRVRTLVKSLDKASIQHLDIPEFTIIEVTNVLWQYVRRHGMALDTATLALSYLRTLPLTIHASSPLLSRAFDISTQYNLAIYDTLHLALAENLQCGLITDDKKQAGVAQQLQITLKPITDFAEYVEPGS
jgi:predicted nucleic acid-binding protein